MDPTHFVRIEKLMTNRGYAFGTLLGVLFALTCASLAAQTGPVREARRDALEELCERVLDLKLDDETTIRQLCLESDALRTDASPLIQGAKLLDPPRYDPEGSCVVSVSIEGGQVAQNVEGHFPDAKGKLDSIGKTKALVAAGFAPLASAGEQPAPPVGAAAGAIRHIPGWAEVSGRLRLRTERAAFEQAVDRTMAQAVKAQITDDLTVEKFLDASDKARETFRAALLDMRALRKAYLAGGVVEVEFRLTADRLLDALKSVNEEAIEEPKQLKVEVFLAAKEKLAEYAVSATGYASVAGKAIDEEALKRPVAVDADDLPKVEPKHLEAAE